MGDRAIDRIVYTAVSQAHERRAAPQRAYPRRLADYRARADALPDDSDIVSGRLAAAPASKPAPFDLAAFRAGWRALAAERGVDPGEGATSFQVAGWKAEQAERARRADADWWQEPALWRYAGPYRSVVEEAAIGNLFNQAGGVYMGQIGALVALRRRQLGGYHAGYDGDALRPLRDVLAARGQQLTFAALGEGGVVSFVMPLRPVGLTESGMALG